ncbi:ABC transporter ATP-binding protein [bacterium 336/3]|jgi:ABC-type multidrug transport system ATPase subunit|nr:ABC transporter ATP-binding protein [bacterium 336/3]
MFQICAENLGKKFHYEWIFRNFSFKFQFGKSYAIVGNNGSGKSTLLQLLSGIIPVSEGKIIYQKNDKNIDSENFYRYIAWVSPYLELIEEMTLIEIVQFHQQFQNLEKNTEMFIKALRLEKATHKYIKNFSSGMKQRVKLGLAMYSETPVLFLDEPTSNLDEENINWYKQEISKQLSKKLIIVASNQVEEYDFCEEIIRLG